MPVEEGEAAKRDHRRNHPGPAPDPGLQRIGHRTGKGLVVGKTGQGRRTEARAEEHEGEEGDDDALTEVAVGAGRGRRRWGDAVLGAEGQHLGPHGRLKGVRLCLDHFRVFGVLHHHGGWKPG